MRTRFYLPGAMLVVLVLAFAANIHANKPAPRDVNLLILNRRQQRTKPNSATRVTGAVVKKRSRRSAFRNPGQLHRRQEAGIQHHLQVIDQWNVECA